MKKTQRLKRTMMRGFLKCTPWMKIGIHLVHPLKKLLVREETKQQRMWPECTETGQQEYSPSDSGYQCSPRGCCSPVRKQWSKQEDHDYSPALLGTVRCFSCSSSLAGNLITSLNRGCFDRCSGLFHPQGNTPEICLQHWVKYSQSWPTSRKKILTNKHVKKYVSHN